jgi:hypothetical protein
MSSARCKPLLPLNPHSSLSLETSAGAASISHPSKEADPADSFFGLKQPRRANPVLPEEVDPETVSWKNIRPDKTYDNIRKMFYQDQQKKRKLS